MEANQIKILAGQASIINLLQRLKEHIEKLSEELDRRKQTKCDSETKAQAKLKTCKLKLSIMEMAQVALRLTTKNINLQANGLTILSAREIKKALTPAQFAQLEKEPRGNFFPKVIVCVCEYVCVCVCVSLVCVLCACVCCVCVCVCVCVCYVHAYLFVV